MSLLDKNNSIQPENFIGHPNSRRPAILAKTPSYEGIATRVFGSKNRFVCIDSTGRNRKSDPAYPPLWGCMQPFFQIQFEATTALKQTC